MMKRYSDNPADLGNHRGEAFVERLVSVIREWNRILKPTGNLFLNFLPQTIDGALSPASWLLPRALAEGGLAPVQALWVVKTNAMPENDTRLLKRSVEQVFHAAKDPQAFRVYKDAVRKPALWSGRDKRNWKYAAGGADAGNFLCPALERLNRLAVRDILAMVCGDEPNALPIAKTQCQATVHPAKMAGEVARWLILYGSAPGGVVADNFAGSGTTLVEAKALGRHYIGGDLNAAYVEQSRDWLAETLFDASAASTPSPARRPGPAPQRAATCRHCGKGFPARKSWQEFCSSTCRYQFHNQRRRRPHGS